MEREDEQGRNQEKEWSTRGLQLHSHIPWILLAEVIMRAGCEDEKMKKMQTMQLE